AIERPVAETGAGPRCTCGPRLTFRRHRRNLSFRGIHHEPRPAALAHLVDVAELGRVADLPFRIPAEELRALERIRLTLLDRVRQFTRGHVLHAPALEFARPLERRAVFVLVRVVALQIRIAPGSPRGLISARESGLGARGSLFGARDVR